MSVSFFKFTLQFPLCCSALNCPTCDNFTPHPTADQRCRVETDKPFFSFTHTWIRQFTDASLYVSTLRVFIFPLHICPSLQQWLAPHRTNRFLPRTPGGLQRDELQENPSAEAKVWPRGLQPESSHEEAVRQAPAFSPGVRRHHYWVSEGAAFPLQEPCGYMPAFLSLHPSSVPWTQTETPGPHQLYVPTHTQCRLPKIRRSGRRLLRQTSHLQQVGVASVDSWYLC